MKGIVSFLSFFFFFSPSLLSATNSFAFSPLFLKPAVESGCGLDQNYIVEDELPPFFPFFFFNYSEAWPPLAHQATPAVRLNSLLFNPLPQSLLEGLFVLRRLNFSCRFFFVCFSMFLFQCDPYKLDLFCQLEAYVKWPNIFKRGEKMFLPPF